MKFIILLLGILVAACTLGHGQNHQTMKTRYYEKPIVEMTLNGKKTWVLLDTGSDITVFNLKSKDRYDFHAHQDFNQQIKVAGFGSRHNQLHQVTNARLYFGEMQLKSDFYAYDITNIVSSIRARTGKHVTAILGTNLMRQYGFVIDMGTNTVSIEYKVKKNKRSQKQDSELTIAKNTK
ncbi:MULTISPECIES: aspartyl protease family protein [Reichenbachiella]|uniref:Aspartyl protease n=1 Tax=Reichenbachiella agariperforans TaxID=156994 RepID=A0A1M6WF58_REIAG|nr:MULTISPECIES: aspartyl protease family protein [Reichenbachiella]MBU2912464.1 aspartyl protease family protein [Reichenbachiella agariperforans]RJE72669.1 hypothetical protein BGP76_01510 [Reichenbachiella sp. MSK19-1]SHK92413.1 Aspartyl protease [Reichenbachiella agariperforans]